MPDANNNAPANSPLDFFEIMMSPYNDNPDNYCFDESGNLAALVPLMSLGW